MAEVLAHYLWEHPRTKGDADVLPRQLKDTSSRALSGTLLSKSALGLFMDAFDLDAYERDRLTKLWEGSARIRVLTGAAAMKGDRARELGQPTYRTLSLHDHHVLGPDGYPVRHRTLHVIEAIADGVDRIVFRADTNAVSVEVGPGCSEVSGPVREIAAGVFAVDMMLAKTLSAGETATVEYETSFQYASQPEREFRRIIVFAVENLDIRVEFHPDKLPRELFWSIWESMDGPVTDSEAVTLDSQFSAQRFVRYAGRTVVGFRWGF